MAAAGRRRRHERPRRLTFGGAAPNVPSVDLSPDVAQGATLCHVQTITQRELRNGSAAVMDAVERGETFRITRHGVAVAELRPLPKDGFTPVAALKQALAGLPADDYEALRAEADAVFGDDRIDG